MDDGKFYVFDFQMYKKEVNVINNNVFEMVFVFVVFEFDVQIVFDIDVYFDVVVYFGWNMVVVYLEVFFVNDIGYVMGDGDVNKVVQFDVDVVVGFVLFFDVFEVEVESLWVLQFVWCGKFLVERQEFVVVIVVEEYFQ